MQSAPVVLELRINCKRSLNYCIAMLRRIHFPCCCAARCTTAARGLYYLPTLHVSVLLLLPPSKKIIKPLVILDSKPAQPGTLLFPALFILGEMRCSIASKRSMEIILVIGNESYHDSLPVRVNIRAWRHGALLFRVILLSRQVRISTMIL